MDFGEAKQTFGKMPEEQAQLVALEFLGDAFWEYFEEKQEAMGPVQQREFSRIVEKILDKPDGTEQEFIRHCVEHCSSREINSEESSAINSIQKNWFGKWQYSGYGGKTIFEIAKMLQTMHRPTTKAINHDLFAAPIHARK